jgi:hypothetical protein
MTTVLTLAALVAGYAVGRARFGHRVSDWAHWQTYGARPARRGLRWCAVWLVLSAENFGWLIAHPVKGLRAWRHRNDPPPPRSPAVAVRHLYEDGQS